MRASARPTNANSNSLATSGPSDRNPSSGRSRCTFVSPLPKVPVTPGTHTGIVRSKAKQGLGFAQRSTKHAAPGDELAGAQHGAVGPLDVDGGGAAAPGPFTGQAQAIAAVVGRTEAM